MKKQDIKIIMANDDKPELIEKKLNSLTEKGYKLQSSKVDWYCGMLEGAFCLVKDMEGEDNYVEEPPYSEEDYEDALSKGLDLDDWSDYEKYYELGSEEDV